MLSWNNYKLLLALYKKGLFSLRNQEKPIKNNRSFIFFDLPFNLFNFFFLFLSFF